MLTTAQKTSGSFLFSIFYSFPFFLYPLQVALDVTLYQFQCAAWLAVYLTDEGSRTMSLGPHRALRAALMTSLTIPVPCFTAP